MVLELVLCAVCAVFGNVTVKYDNVFKTQSDIISGFAKNGDVEGFFKYVSIFHRELHCCLKEDYDKPNEFDIFKKSLNQAIFLPTQKDFENTCCAGKVPENETCDRNHKNYYNQKCWNALKLRVTRYKYSATGLFVISIVLKLFNLVLKLHIP